MRFSSKCIHEGEREIEGAVIFPIFATSTFKFPMEGAKYVYSRSGNPTVEVVEKKVASLEGFEKGIAFSSGMAAISTTILATSVNPKNVKIVTHTDKYGGTIKLFKKLIKYGFIIENYDIDALPENVGDADIVFIESITNPLIKIPNLPEIRKNTDAIIIVDNTFASPYNFQPKKFGADIVLHSATKYLGGHSDIIAGITLVDSQYYNNIKGYRSSLGGSMDPFTAFLLNRGIKTLHVRMERHNENGQAVAEFLNEHPKVEYVYYPGLKDNPYYSVGKKLMRGFGGMVSFDIKGGKEEANKFIHKLKLITRAVSLGGVESLATIPADVIMSGLTEEERGWVKENTIRLSIGLEDIDDLIEDIDKALK